MQTEKRIQMILETLPEEHKRILSKNLPYCAPEALLSYVNDFVNKNIPKSAKSTFSVSVYSALLGITPEEVKLRFIMDGFL